MFWVGIMALDKWEQTFPKESWGSRAPVPMAIPASVMAPRPSTGIYEKKRISSWVTTCARVRRWDAALQTCPCPEVLRQGSTGAFFCLCLTQPWDDLVMSVSSFSQAPFRAGPLSQDSKNWWNFSCPMEGRLDFHFDYTFEIFFSATLRQGK